MTNFAICYSYFDHALGRSGHGQAIVRIETKSDGEGEGDSFSDGQLLPMHCAVVQGAGLSEKSWRVLLLRLLWSSSLVDRHCNLV